jgi:serine/threonine protein kinase
LSRQEQLAGVNEGDVLAGKYRVDKVLGIGGMGVVVAAHHIHLDDRVAIKFLLPETLGNAEAVMRFAREARAAVKIKSEHVARVTDVGTLENGAPYMVMEYLEGADLSCWLSERGALPVERAVDFMLQACEAIAEAHALGIVHRDLKPANLFVARLPGSVETIKVLDFGISKLTGLSASGGESSQTKTSALMGSPLYMSPEQMQSSKNVDTRGDIWALGVILYELVTGAAPFVADTMPELILSIMSSPPGSLRSHRPDLPEGLEAVVARCLEKDRTKRYQTVGDMALALLPFGSKRARASVDRISQVMQAAGMATSLPSQPPPSTHGPERLGAGTAAAFGRTAPETSNKKSYLLAAGAVVVLGGAATLFLLHGRGESAASSAAPVSPEPSAAALKAVPAAAETQVAEPAKAETAAIPVNPAQAPAPSEPGSVAVQPSPPSAVSKFKAKPRPVPAAAPGGAAPASAPAPVVKKPSESSLIDDRK